MSTLDVFCHSILKFKWLTQASELNPFDSKFFFWIDAGGSRFFDSYDLKLEYPSPPALEA